MNRILTITGLTWKAAFRYRLFWVLAVLLATSVVAFPLLLKDDGTARGLTQILLTYTLSAITGLLGFSTLWLSCGTLARDIEECQMQVVSVKPIGRWQIWLGKWIGVVSLNAALVGLSGAGVYALLQFRADTLPPAQQTILKKEIFVARASAKPTPPNMELLVAAVLQKRIKQLSGAGTLPNEALLRKQITQMVLAENLSVKPGSFKRFVVELGANFVKSLNRESLNRDNAVRVRGQTLQVRVKFRSSDPLAAEGAVYQTLWQVGVPESGNIKRLEKLLPAESFQEFELPPDMFDSEGRLTLDFYNANDVALWFGQDDGLEVFYTESTFGMNFIRGLGIILCWLALLASIGLAASSWLSFPVAAFASITVLVMGLCSGILSSAIEQGTIFGLDHETNQPVQPAFDSVILPIFKSALAVINLVKDFSPIDSLSTGRSITWGELGLAFAQIVLLMGGIFAAAGIALFSRRELAAAQVNS